MNHNNTVSKFLSTDYIPQYSLDLPEQIQSVKAVQGCTLAYQKSKYLGLGNIFLVQGKEMERSTL